MIRRSLIAIVAIVALVATRFAATPEAPRASPRSVKPLIGFVTNSASDFWSYAKAGATKAAGEAGVELDFRISKEAAAAEQQTILEDMVTRGAAGIAISPIDPSNQTPLL